MKLIHIPIALIATGLTHFCGPVHAETILAPIHRISASGVHERLGTFSARTIKGSVEVRVELSNFPPGWHAMHVHEHPSCDPGIQDGKLVPGGASGMHYDPTGTMMVMNSATGGTDDPLPPGRRPRPLGDLPTLFTDANGTTDARILVYRLTLDQFFDRSVVLHAYSQVPEDPGLPKGGGPKIACAVLSSQKEPLE